METSPQGSCRAAGCSQQVHSALAREVLCLDHYLEKAGEQLRNALQLCQKGHPVDPRLLDWLLEGADFAVHVMAQDGDLCTPDQRVKVLELLLGLANLQHYVRHHSVRVMAVEEPLA